MMIGSPEWKIQRRNNIKAKIQKLADKLGLLTVEISKFGPRKYRKGFRIFTMKRNGMVKHWHKMAMVSMDATRKKIYTLQQELKTL